MRKKIPLSLLPVFIFSLSKCPLWAAGEREKEGFSNTVTVHAQCKPAVASSNGSSIAQIRAETAEKLGNIRKGADETFKKLTLAKIARMQAEEKGNEADITAARENEALLLEEVSNFIKREKDVTAAAYEMIKRVRAATKGTAEEVAVAERVWQSARKRMARLDAELGLLEDRTKAHDKEEREKEEEAHAAIRKLEKTRGEKAGEIAKAAVEEAEAAIKKAARSREEAEAACKALLEAVVMHAEAVIRLEELKGEAADLERIRTARETAEDARKKLEGAMPHYQQD